MGNCKFDTWSFFQGGQLTRLEVDTNKNEIVDVWEYYDGSGRRTLQAEARGRCAKPNIVFHFAEDGESITVQEEDQNCNGRPDRYTRFGEGGIPEFTCTLRTAVQYEAGLVLTSVEDTTRDGYGDQRQVFAEGIQTRFDADTNGDRIPDVWVNYANGAPETQDEDSDFDGQIDVRFDLATEDVVPLNGTTAPPVLEAFEQIRCTDFSEFWSGGMRARLALRGTLVD